MKRVKLIHGSARVEDNVSNETIVALNKMVEIAYTMPTKCNYCGRTEICKGSYPEGCFLENDRIKNLSSLEIMECQCEYPEIYTDKNGINYCTKCMVETMIFKPIKPSVD